jgi:hypothetical protein
MPQLLRRRITAIWLLLVLATILSWGTALRAGQDSARLASVTVIAVAFIKVRFVVLDFMELRTAPLPLRLVFEGWLLIVGGAIMLLTAT